MIPPAVAKRTETVAWMIMWTFFGLFCLLVAGAVMAGLWYKNTATESHDAKLKVLTGTVLIQSESQANWFGAAPETTLKAGDRIKTDDTSQALLNLFDDSMIVLYPRTELRLTNFTSWKFAPEKRYINLFQQSGRTRVIVNPSQGEDKRFEVTLPQGFVSLSGGIFSFNIDSDIAQVKVRDGGKATVTGASTSIELQKGQRVDLVAGKAPSGPEAAQVELIRNGNFSRGLDGWRVGDEIGFLEGQDIRGSAEVIIEHGQPAVRFWREGSKSSHSETYIQQGVNADVADFSKLELSLELKLVNQSLSGGGYLGSEYPVLVRVNYLTPRGENFKVYGFYYQNEANNRTDNGVKLTQNVWEQYTIRENLIETLSPPPLKILSIRIAASGWDYESLVSNVSLVGE